MRITQIQGLRAVAAILVTVFHARLVPGGFIGVDIFYVISGYLITGLILREIENTGTLDLRSFYQRRIKRLIPTSVFVLFVTAILRGFSSLLSLVMHSVGISLLRLHTSLTIFSPGGKMTIRISMPRLHHLFTTGL